MKYLLHLKLTPKEFLFVAKECVELGITEDDLMIFTNTLVDSLELNRLIAYIYLIKIAKVKEQLKKHLEHYKFLDALGYYKRYIIHTLEVDYTLEGTNSKLNDLFRLDYESKNTFAVYWNSIKNYIDKQIKEKEITEGDIDEL